MATCNFIATALPIALFVFFLTPRDRIVEAQDRKLEQRIDALIKVFAHPEAQGENIEETARAVEELAAIGKPAVPKLLEAMLNKNFNVAGYSANALDEIGPPGVELVRSSWPRWNEGEKWKFMRFRGKFDYQKSLDFALASLESKNPKMRRLAIEYAGEHKEAQARRPLIKMLNTEVPKEHRWLVIESLGNLGYNDEAADALIALLAPNSWVAKGQGLTPPPGYPPPWWPDGRDHVIEALGKMGARKAAPKLLEVLREKETNKGFYFNPDIVRLLGEWGYTECIPELKRLLVLKHEGCSNQNVARALLQLKDRSGMPLLMKYLKSKDAHDRRFACKTFAEHGDKSDVLLLGNCLNDTDFDVQRQACLGLERITGVVNREPGQTMHTSADIPLWIAWFEQNKAKYQRGK